MNTDQLDREQNAINRMTDAKSLANSPLLNEIFVALEAGYVDKLSKVKKGRGYLDELAEIHDSLQNLKRMQGYIQDCINKGKVVEEKQRKRLFSKQ